MQPEVILVSLTHTHMLTQMLMTYSVMRYQRTFHRGHVLRKRNIDVIYGEQSGGKDEMRSYPVTSVLSCCGGGVVRFTFLFTPHTSSEVCPTPACH